MKKITVKATLIRAERLNNSFYGNPRYYAVFKTADGFLKGNTASDEKIAYRLYNNKFAEKNLTYHITRTGNIIFDYVKEA